jgi:hypothetical protein
MPATRMRADGLRTLDCELTGLSPVPTLPKPVLGDRLAGWRRLLRSSTTQARAVLQRIPKGRLTLSHSLNTSGGHIRGHTFAQS